MTQIAVEAPPHVARANQISLRSVLFFSILALLWFILCRALSNEWSANEQYSYGWFVPFFAAFLFWLRWEDRPAPGATSSVSSPDQDKWGRHRGRPSRIIAALIALAALAVLFPVRLFEIANPDWRPLGWLHAGAVVALTMLVIWSLGGRSWLRHFAFPVAFIFVAVPWVTPIEAPIVQGLMRIVAAGATEVLTLCGIPAQLEGSLIRVNSGVVGVSEACSGVRSLQTSLMIGLLFGELPRLTITRRAILVAAALSIALLANFARAFFLVAIAATKNLAEVDRWHDVAGYSIVIAVFLGTLAIAAAIAKGKNKKAESRNIATPSAVGDMRIAGRNSHFSLPPSSFLLPTFLYLLLVEATVEGWYRWHERNFVPTTSWNVSWPELAPGFRIIPIDDHVKSTLRFDTGREATWQLPLRNSPNEPATLPAHCTMFFLRWEPGSASILRARAHRPDICLPSSGWRVDADDGVRPYAVTAEFALPFRHFCFVRDAPSQRQMFAQAFFCQREDRVPRRRADRSDVTSGVPGSWGIADRLRVVRDGVRNQGQQVLEIVILTTHALNRSEAEAEFATLVPKLVKPVSE